MPSTIALAYRRWALLFLGVTVVVGAWMRAILAWPPAGPGVDFTHLRHAHSHVAFFGWVTMAIFSLTIAAARPDAAVARRLSRYGTALGVASIAAFASFLHGGYDAPSIAISVAHVALWIAFVAAAWPLLGAVDVSRRRLYRGSLCFLLAAGASTLGPGIVLARHVADPWLGSLAVKAFLALFIGGFVMLGTYGAMYAFVERARFASWALGLVAIGAPATALLHVSETPPVAWIVPVGRAGTLLVGVASLLVASDLLRARVTLPLLRLATGALAIKGVVELLAAAGIGLALIRSQPIVVAYLHLVLLGVVTTALLGAMTPTVALLRRTVALGSGIVVMLAALLSSGWPLAYAVAGAAGVTIVGLLHGAFGGGIVAAAAALAIIGRATSSDRT